MKNNLLIRVLRGKKTERTPVWIMRQAGRYLPEYRQTRAQAGGFMDLCRNPDLACEVTLQPVERFPLDAAILFSDILTIPDAMGLGLQFVSGEGPTFAHPVRTAKDIAALRVPDMNDDLRYVMDAVRTIRHELAGRVPLIGFSGSPWTLATYMIEGRASRDFSIAKKMLFAEPDLLRQLLTTLTSAVSAYLSAQIAAGAQVVMIFDTWGGILPHWAYEQFSLHYMRQIIANLQQAAPVIVFTKGGGQWLPALKTCGATGIGVDWTTSLQHARAIVGDEITLQGNLDPMVLHAPPAVIEAEVARVLADYGMGGRHIFNLGHGITPDIPPEHVMAMIEAVQQFSPRYHSEES